MYNPIQKLDIYPIGTMNTNGGDIQPLVSIPVTSSCTFVWKMMGEHLLNLSFVSEEPKKLERGCMLIYNGMKYTLTEPFMPERDTATGVFKYDIQIRAFFERWSNFIFKYRPAAFASGFAETDWSITAPLNMVCDIIARNLVAEGLEYEFYPFLIQDSDGTYDPGEQIMRIDLQVDDKTLNTISKPLKFSQNTIREALDIIADAWECEWWWTIHTSASDKETRNCRYVLHFGKLKVPTAVKTLYDVPYSTNTDPNAISIKEGARDGTYFNRLYVFGSERNIPTYYPVDDDIFAESDEVRQSVVQKRLMVRREILNSTGSVQRIEPNYIDVYRYLNGKKVYIGEAGYDSPNSTEMPPEEVVEAVAINEDIYPRREYIVDWVIQTTIDDEEFDERGNKTVTTRPIYHIHLSYYKPGETKLTPLVFSKKYILPNAEPLEMTFQMPEKKGETIEPNTHLLTGMTFEVIYNSLYQNPESEYSGNYFEIKRNEDYGILLPNETLCPKKGDHCALLNFDCTAVAGGLDILKDAEKELYEWGVKEAKNAAADERQYEVTLTPHAAQKMSLAEGESVVLNSGGVNYRKGRVIGIEYKLDFPFDNPIYTIGDSRVLSRFESGLKAVESQINNLGTSGIATSQINLKLNRISSDIKPTIKNMQVGMEQQIQQINTDLTIIQGRQQVLTVPEVEGLINEYLKQ